MLVSHSSDHRPWQPRERVACSKLCTDRKQTSQWVPPQCFGLNLQEGKIINHHTSCCHWVAVIEIIWWSGKLWRKPTSWWDFKKCIIIIFFYLRFIVLLIDGQSKVQRKIPNPSGEVRPLTWILFTDILAEMIWNSSVFQMYVFF